MQLSSWKGWVGDSWQWWIHFPFQRSSTVLTHESLANIENTARLMHFGMSYVPGTVLIIACHTVLTFQMWSDLTQVIQVLNWQMESNLRLWSPASTARGVALMQRASLGTRQWDCHWWPLCLCSGLLAQVQVKVGAQIHTGLKKHTGFAFYYSF